MAGVTVSDIECLSELAATVLESASAADLLLKQTKDGWDAVRIRAENTISRLNALKSEAESQIAELRLQRDCLEIEAARNGESPDTGSLDSEIDELDIRIYNLDRNIEQAHEITAEIIGEARDYATEMEQNVEVMHMDASDLATRLKRAGGNLEKYLATGGV